MSGIPSLVLKLGMALCRKASTPGSRSFTFHRRGLSERDDGTARHQPPVVEVLLFIGGYCHPKATKGSVTSSAEKKGSVTSFAKKKDRSLLLRKKKGSVTSVARKKGIGHLFCRKKRDRSLLLRGGKGSVKSFAGIKGIGHFLCGEKRDPSLV